MDERKAVEESEFEVIADFRSIIGTDNTIALIKRCGGTQVYIPSMDRVLKCNRDEAIYSDFKKGLALKTIALKYSLAECTTRDIIRKKVKLIEGKTIKRLPRAGKATK